MDAAFLGNVAYPLGELAQGEAVKGTAFQRAGPFVGKLAADGFEQGGLSAPVGT